MDISGDAGVRAYGITLEETFKNAALGMYSLITNPEDIKEADNIVVEVEGHSTEGLLVAWLNELIFRFDAYGFTGKRIELLALKTAMQDDKPYIKAKVYGEEFDIGRHEKGLLLKAATYHKLKIEKIDGIWQADVVFDI